MVPRTSARAARSDARWWAQGWRRRAVAGVRVEAGSPQVRYEPGEGCVDESGPDTRGAHQGQSAMVVMDRLSLDRNLKERRIVGWCGKAVDSQGCDIGC